MSIRSRSRNFTYSQGYAETIVSGTSGGHVPSQFWTLQQNCQDVADGPGVDHPFSLTSYYAEPTEDGIEPINGINPSGIATGSGYHNYLPSGYHGARLHASVPGSAITANDYAAVLARSNPSRPVVTPLTLLQDLVDIPRQLKDVGRLLKGGTKGLNPREIANQNLGIQFGWLPLVNDVMTLMHLQSHIDRRFNELTKLYNRSGLKRRIKLGTFHAEETVNSLAIVSHPQRGSLSCKLTRNTSVTKWGTVRWKPTGHPPVFSDTQQRNRFVRNLVLGLSSEGTIKGLWDVLPWTWMTDWFVNAGDYLIANSNTVPASAQHLNVMRETETLMSFSRASGSSWISGGTGVTRYSTKERSNNIASAPFASIPIVGIGRLSILSSLFIQRFK